MNTFSKSISPSIRIGYLVLPQHLLSLVQDRVGFYSCTVPSFEQYTLARFIASGSLMKHINRMKNTYRSIRDDLISWLLDGPYAEKISIHEEDAGLHFLMRLTTELSEEEVISIAMGQGVYLQSMKDYLVSPRADYRSCYVINYSSVTKQQLCAVTDSMQ